MSTSPASRAHTGEAGAGQSGQSLVHRSNNLDGLRLAGALAVLVGHAYHLVGRGAEAPVILGYQLQALGVVVFFSISGYLITASWERRPDLLAYTAARFLRIVPGLLVAVVVSVVALGTVLTTLSPGEYLTDGRTWSYLNNVAMRPQYDLPGVFLTNPYPVAVNGSLWTLPAEVFCYVAVPLVAVLARGWARLPALGALLLVALALARVPALESPVIYGTRISDAAGMWAFFAAGALVRTLVSRGRLTFRTDVAVAGTAAYVLIIAVFPAWVPNVSWLVLPYVVLTVGHARTPVVRDCARFGDLSYGIYLYAFPVQQVLIATVGVLSMPLNILAVTAITAFLAWLSWRAVEAPSLALKDRATRSRQGRRARRPEVERAVEARREPSAPRATQ
jgi:peptidoglycan/LPS O-acetylase OafA/YrhL